MSSRSLALLSMQLSPKYTVREWDAAFEEKQPDWDRAISIVEDRIRGRFIQWIDPLVDQRFAGFVVLAINCILLETLRDFREGSSSLETNTDVWVQMLTAKPFLFDDTQARRFYSDVRCGILHNAETRGIFKIRRDPQPRILDTTKAGHIVVNRTMFHSAVVQIFTDWIELLRSNSDEGKTARGNMCKRMNDIINSSAR